MNYFTAPMEMNPYLALFFVLGISFAFFYLLYSTYKHIKHISSH